MKFTLLLAALLVMTSLSAQSSSKNHPITKESFKVKLKVEKSNVRVLSFVDSKGRKRRAEGFYESGDVIPFKALKAGTIVEGVFRFDSFASAGGLGSTRVAKGQGKGYLKVLKIDFNGKLFPPSNKLAGVGDMAFRLN